MHFKDILKKKMKARKEEGSEKSTTQKPILMTMFGHMSRHIGKCSVRLSALGGIVAL